MVAGEEHPRVVAAFRPPVAHHADAVEAVLVGLLPIGEEIIEDRIQPLVGR